MPLFVVPTPIGNMDDMTPRGIEALRRADVIACEDTRRTVKLLNRHGVKRPMVSYHRHNERARAEELIGRLRNGENIALVSDAGTPGISDPGWILIAEAIAEGLPVDALPGANALLPALLLSGISPQPFLFNGFLEGRDSERASRIAELAGVRATLVFYVAPHDLERELALLASVLGDRRAAVVREISKVHQEAIRGTLVELTRAASGDGMRGEMALVVEGARESAEAEAEDEDREWKRLALHMKDAGIFDKTIVNVLIASYGIPRNKAKTFLLTGGNQR
ncbi:MAG: 16S rRNA (cytidine(1402)-2'-O)-methyltransferase [Synergistaceae bacterium]|jgi:16S rRNA (cytidine1402-2'-O)-methyltransferase|nr:16S rRNA (cytidine(1402)-2'-O)-methyltransferase [Synergistaceae bacterium]